MFGRIAAALFVLVCASSTNAQDPSRPVETTPTHEDWYDTCEDWDEWDKPGPPYKVFGNTYYVGTCGIAAILIAGNEGHVLIDSGTEGGAEIVARNIEQLGFRLQDVKLILHSHEHHDHIGGLEKLRKLTGAHVVTSKAARKTVETGQVSSEDPQFATHEPMTPTQVERAIEGGDFVGGGDLELEAIATPGHTPGALSWFWTSCEGAVCLRIVYADSLSPVSSDTYRFTDHPSYLEKYRTGLKKLASVECEILLTPHPSASAMRKRSVSTLGLLGEDLCRDYAASIEARLDARLAKEASE